MIAPALHAISGVVLSILWIRKIVVYSGDRNDSRVMPNVLAEGIGQTSKAPHARDWP